jgi:hypothetical protein
MLPDGMLSDEVFDGLVLCIYRCPWTDCELRGEVECVR